MQFKMTLARVVIEYSEPEVSTLITGESNIVADTDAFHSEILKWAADRARQQAFDGKNASDELRRWSREYFGSVENRPSAGRDDVGQTVVEPAA